MVKLTNFNTDTISSLLLISPSSTFLKSKYSQMYLSSDSEDKKLMDNTETVIQQLQSGFIVHTKCHDLSQTFSGDEDLRLINKMLDKLCHEVRLK